MRDPTACFYSLKLRAEKSLNFNLTLYPKIQKIVGVKILWVCNSSMISYNGILFGFNESVICYPSNANFEIIQRI